MRWLYLIVTILVLSSFEFIAMSHYRGGPDILLILTVFGGLRMAPNPAFAQNRVLNRRAQCGLDYRRVGDRVCEMPQRTPLKIC